MATRQDHQSYSEEKLTLLALSSTYGIYAFGGLYVLGSVIGYMLAGIVLLRSFVGQGLKVQSVSAMQWVWHIGMLTMLLALFIGHANWNLGMPQTIKSTIGWAKGWALMSLFIWLGACSYIRPHYVVRGVSLVAIHSLVFALISVLAYIAGISGDIYVSPLKVVGGPGPDFFKVSLFGMNPETGAGRWQFFGPWAPSAGLIACLSLVIVSLEKNDKIRRWAYFGCFVIVVLSQSRAGLAIFLVLIPLLSTQKSLKHPALFFIAGVGLPALLLLGQPLFEAVMDSYQQVKDARPDSTRVRNALANIAIQRWQSEAFWFGHGIIERGPKMVEFMPIGTHHSWYGLLFVKGLVGLFALAIPLFISAVYLVWQGIHSKLAHRALCLVFVLLCYSFFENLEILMYLCWPAFLIIGMAFTPQKLENYDA
ncbi:O-antigen ligase domain-containing protein [Alteromonas sp. ASW11-36]|uniref:O-antigen ligase domain-containing protein n=1 Tax=Alteromonas arenosi TaxID=3055817 RepID=A0ABT7SSZ5_9ALTE|nr:O-antigen ligase family protein [Alteromonas sp. ASW11-36]MDM7859314.1 O-antigen ligase domain-containing protein [Alteromonas sp. ASW11-36]